MNKKELQQVNTLVSTLEQLEDLAFKVETYEVCKIMILDNTLELEQEDLLDLLELKRQRVVTEIEKYIPWESKPFICSKPRIWSNEENCYVPDIRAFAEA